MTTETNSTPSDTQDGTSDASTVEQRVAARLAALAQVCHDAQDALTRADGDVETAGQLAADVPDRDEQIARATLARNAAQAVFDAARASHTLYADLTRPLLDRYAAWRAYGASIVAGIDDAERTPADRIAAAKAAFNAALAAAAAVDVDDEAATDAAVAAVNVAKSAYDRARAGQFETFTLVVPGGLLPPGTQPQPQPQSKSAPTPQPTNGSAAPKKPRATNGSVPAYPTFVDPADGQRKKVQAGINVCPRQVAVYHYNNWATNRANRADGSPPEHPVLGHKVTTVKPDGTEVLCMSMGLPDGSTYDEYIAALQAKKPGYWHSDRLAIKGDGSQWDMWWDTPESGFHCELRAPGTGKTAEDYPVTVYYAEN